MNEYSTRELSELLYDDLSVIEDNEGTATEITLAQPTTESLFPCRVLDTPLESIDKTSNATPLLKTFQVSIEHWDENPLFCMEMANNTDLILRERNFIRTSSSPNIFDQITKKYHFTTTYEVKWNALTNAFHYIR